MASGQDAPGARGGFPCGVVVRWIIRGILVCLAFAIAVHLHSRIVLWNYLRECEANNVGVACYGPSLLPANIKSVLPKKIAFWFDFAPKRLRFWLIKISQAPKRQVGRMVDAYPLKNSVEWVDLIPGPFCEESFDNLRGVLRWPSIRYATAYIHFDVNCQNEHCSEVLRILDDIQLLGGESVFFRHRMQSLKADEMELIKRVIDISSRTPNLQRIVTKY